MDQAPGVWASGRRNGFLFPFWHGLNMKQAEKSGKREVGGLKQVVVPFFLFLSPTVLVTNSNLCVFSPLAGEIL